jgi:hypothetical protein
MPTKRRRRMRAWQAPKPLSRGVRGLLLHGWTEGRRAYGWDNPLDVYLLSDDDLRGLWRTHRADVTAEAERLGVTSWARDYFNGEVER